MRFQDHRLEADLGQQPGHMLGGQPLTGPEWSPGFDVSILIRSRQMSTTSCCAVTWFAVTVLSSHPGLSLACRVAACAVPVGMVRRFTGLCTRLRPYGLLM